VELALKVNRINIMSQHYTARKYASLLLGLSWSNSDKSIPDLRPDNTLLIYRA